MADRREKEEGETGTSAERLACSREDAGRAGDRVEETEREAGLRKAACERSTKAARHRTLCTMSVGMQKRIKLERRRRDVSKITELNLDNCRSNDIVGLTSDFVNLESLSLINVGLQSLNKFPRLPKLKKLELSDNRISGGLQVLSGCPKLRLLGLSGNRIRDIDTLKPLAELNNLWSLNLFNCEVTNLDDYRGRVFEILPQLTYLDGYNKDDKCDDYEEEGEDFVGEDEEEENDDVHVDDKDDDGDDDDGEGREAGRGAEGKRVYGRGEVGRDMEAGGEVGREADDVIGEADKGTEEGREAVRGAEDRRGHGRSEIGRGIVSEGEAGGRMEERREAGRGTESRGKVCSGEEVMERDEKEGGMEEVDEENESGEESEKDEEDGESKEEVDIENETREEAESEKENSGEFAREGIG